MAVKQEQKLIPCLVYEHRKKDGTLITYGETIIDRHRKTHYIQKDAGGKKISELIVDKNGNVVEDIVIGEGQVPNKPGLILSKFMNFFKEVK